MTRRETVRKMSFDEMAVEMRDEGRESRSVEFGDHVTRFRVRVRLISLARVV